ncbi:MAG: dihydroneopterin aldolase [Prevotella sp.]|nr:dihydroneopterin aldolase [Prevotella sp.]
MVLRSSHITLSGLRFHAYHGVMAQERQAGGDFLVDLQVMCDLEKAVHSDDLSDTLNYGTLYDLVHQEMMQPSQLLEHVAGRIAQRVFDGFPQVENVVITVTKVNPPMGADLKGASVTLFFGREE